VSSPRCSRLVGPCRCLLFLCLLGVGIALGAAPAWGQSITGGEVECQDGTADEYPCQNADLLSHLSISDLGGSSSTQINDVWGWTDPQTNTEYALVGRTDGVAFVDVSTPTEPVYVGELPTHSGSSTWRDLKVYKGHAFVVSEAAGHGMQVFDLTQLRTVDPSDQPVTFAETAHYDEVGSAHNIVINTETGFGYIVGGNGTGTTCGGGLHMMNLETPTAPVFVGCFTDPSAGTGYTHDAQCTVYQGPDPDYQDREVCFNANEDALNVADVSDKNNPATITNATYPLIGYVHQAWLTEDHRYLYVDDELDELEGLVSQTRTLVFDVTDLDSPELVTSYSGATGAIDHNQYIAGSYSYQANYASGLRILDVASPESPEEVAYFDTYAAGNPTSFSGAWSTYPFFDDMVLVSSIGEGLFVVEPELTSIVRFAADTSAAAENAGTDTLIVELVGFDPTTDIEVDVAFDSDASTAETDDIGNYSTQTITFPASTSAGATRSVTVDLTDDADAEGTEVARFDLANLSGSGNAAIGSPARAALSIVGDDRTIAEARTALQNEGPEELILDGTVSRAFGSHARLQDESGPTGASGFVVRQTAGSLSTAFQQDIANSAIRPGTQLRVRGTLSEVNGLVQLRNDDLTSYTVQDQGSPLPPQPVSLGDLTGTSGNDYESELIEVTGLTFPNVSSDSSFAANTSYEVTDGSATLPFRVHGSDESALIGETIPTGTFTFTGVLGQSSDNGTGGYQLLGIRRKTALPVELTDFDAVQREASVVLSWQTTSETSNAGFRVQRQTEGGWATLGFVQSAAPYGTTAEPQSYRYTVDQRLAPGTHRFRLRQEDLDGATHLSPVVAVEVDMDAALRLRAPAPNPAAGQASVSFGVKTATTASVALYDVLGQRVMTLYRGTPKAGEMTTVEVRTGPLPSGVYFVRLKAHGQTRTQRLTVVR